MARGQFTRHTDNCQAELLSFLRDAGGSASIVELFEKGLGWGIRSSTIRALLRKGL